MFYHSLKLKQTKCICMYFSEERLQYLCKVPHIICSFWTLIFLEIETLKLLSHLIIIMTKVWNKMNLSETARKQKRNIIQSQIVKGFFFQTRFQ